MDIDTKATSRALMALMVDLQDLVETTERVRVQVHALAARHGIEPTAAK